MTKAIEYVVELNDREAEIFLQDILDPKPNPARDKFIDEVNKFRIEVRR